MDAVTHHGRETAYRRWDRGGEGPTLLCIHGSGATHRIWKSQARLADEYPVVAMDLSGHGESEDIDASHGFETLSAYADDVLAVAGATDADVLVGNSLGGAVVLHVAVERDFDAEAYVLAGTGAKLAVMSDLRDWLANDFERAVEFLHGEGRLLYDPDERLLELSTTAMRETGQAVTRRDFMTCHTFDVRDDLDAVTAPTLAIVGEHDGLTPPRYHEYLADHIPDAARAVVEDAAHLAMLEQPEAFNAGCREFLESL